jgi:hypothetical protein
MSRAYPDQHECPDRGLTVGYNEAAGRYQAHVSKAFTAGLLDTPCVDWSRDARAIARNYKREAAGSRAEYWRSRDPESALPPSFRNT